MENKTIISVQNIDFSFGNQTIFKDFSTEFERESFTCILGESGSGKSTLIKLLEGQLTLQMGMIKNRGSIYYLPQINTLNSSVFNTSILDWINAFSDEWWQITTLLEDRFTTELDLSQSIASFIVVALTLLLLSFAFLITPDILLLAVPTTHLALVALSQSRLALQAFHLAFHIVTTKPTFLAPCFATLWS